MLEQFTATHWTVWREAKSQFQTSVMERMTAWRQTGLVRVHWCHADSTQVVKVIHAQVVKATVVRHSVDPVANGNNDVMTLLPNRVENPAEAFDIYQPDFIAAQNAQNYNAYVCNFIVLP